MHICAHKTTLPNTVVYQASNKSNHIEKQGKGLNSAATGKDKNIAEHEKRGRKSLKGWKGLQKIYVV